MKKIILVLATTVMLFMFTAFVNADINSTTIISNADTGDQCNGVYFSNSPPESGWEITNIQVCDGMFVQRQQESAKDRITVRDATIVNNVKGRQDDQDATTYFLNKDNPEFTLNEDESIEGINISGDQSGTYSYTDTSADVQLDSYVITNNVEPVGVEVAPKIPNNGVYFFVSANTVYNHTFNQVPMALRGSVLKTPFFNNELISKETADPMTNHHNATNATMVAMHYVVPRRPEVIHPHAVIG